MPSITPDLSGDRNPLSRQSPDLQAGQLRAAADPPALGILDATLKPVYRGDRHLGPILIDLLASDPTDASRQKFAHNVN
jgi:hypothetical protein